MKNRREICTSGSVRDEDGQPPHLLGRRTLLHIAAGASALASLSLPHAMGQEAYPSRPIHVIVGFTAGAASDVTARILGDSMRPILGQQIIVEDRPGAGSSIAAEYVAHAANDGYTLFVATLSIITNQIINPNPSFDLTRDLAPVALLASGAVVLVVNPEINVHSVAELIALAKSKPGQVLHATVMGSLPHLASELFAQRAGIKLMQVPYQGSPQTVTDVIAGRVMMTFSPASTVVGQIAAGKLTALATAANKRSSALPNVPTMAEAGIPDFDASLWFGLLAPAGTPRPVIEKLADAAQKAIHAPEAVDRLRTLGFDPLDAGPDKFADYIRSEVARWSAVARAAGLRS
jgi:tripartite-type tricarboxylate transporter receptor subunit TctC